MAAYFSQSLMISFLALILNGENEMLRSLTYLEENKKTSLANNKLCDVLTFCSVNMRLYAKLWTFSKGLVSAYLGYQLNELIRQSFKKNNLALKSQPRNA